MITAIGNNTIAVLLATLLLCIGCGYPRESSTERSGIERALISAAVDRACAKLKLESIKGERAYLDASGIQAVDKEYIVSVVRDVLARRGARWTDTPEEASFIVHARAGIANTDSEGGELPDPEAVKLAVQSREESGDTEEEGNEDGIPGHDFLIGIPPLRVASFEDRDVYLPEVTLIKSNMQYATAMVAVNAVRRSDSELVESTDPCIGIARFKRWNVLLFFYFQTSDVPMLKRFW